MGNFSKINCCFVETDKVVKSTYGLELKLEKMKTEVKNVSPTASATSQVLRKSAVCLKIKLFQSKARYA